MSTPPPKGPLKLLRAAAALVVLVALGMTVWLIDKAVLNPDVKAKRPSWFETGVFDVPFWLPLIVTVVGGAACVVYVYVRAARRLREGEDIFGESYRDKQRRGETGRKAEQEQL